MTRETISGLNSRNNLAERLVQSYKTKTAPKITLLTGPSGSGKSFVINKIILDCKTKFIGASQIRPVINYGDAFVLANGRYKGQKVSDISMSVGTPVISFGAGIGVQSEETQYNRLKSILRTHLKTDVLFCIDDLSTSDSAVKAIAKIMLSHLDELEKSLSIKIYFLISDADCDSCLNLVLGHSTSVMHILLRPYDTEDICQYLEDQHLNVTIADQILKNITAMQKISNGNLSLVDFLFVDIAVQNTDYFRALEEIVNYRLARLKEVGRAKHVAEPEMEDIILSSALSLDRFSTSEISQITHRDDNTVASSLDIAKEEVFIDKDTECFYEFHCTEIKNALWKQSIEKRKERLLYYYQYYTQNEQDEYYFRAFYLIKYANTITSQAFALLVLSFAYARRLSDFDVLAKIERLMNDYSTAKQKVDFEQIECFYKLLEASQDKIDYNLLEITYQKIKSAGHEIPLQGELTRAYFLFLYRNRPPFDPTLSLLLEECIQFARTEVSLSPFTNPIGLKETDETIIRLNTIYSIAPYLLDARNEIKRFTELYQLSRDISQNCRVKGARGLAQYIENVFNRKAFLFVNQTQCSIYYERAKGYFLNNQMWDEYCITLVCQAGTDIVIQKYSEAQDLCKQALDIASTYGITIPQPAKLHNNMLIAAFMNVEQQTKSERKSVAAAKRAIKLLKKQLSKIPCATEYVILTNLCSLFLYCGDDINYLKYKEKLQRMIPCSEISNIEDEDIDDFYRYYFAWFEAYRMIRDGMWEQAEAIYHTLDGFVPSLFQKQEVFWERKNKALLQLIRTRTQLCPYDFCNNLVHTSRRETVLSQFFFRGLMLSDIQYTSYA